MGWTIVVRPKEMEVLRACRRQWDFDSRLRQNLVPIKPAKMFDFDLAMHQALAVWYFPAMDDWSRVIVRPVALKGFERKMREDRGAYAEFHEMTPEMDEEFEKYLKLGEAVLSRYFDWATTADDFDSILADEDIWTAVPDPDAPENDLGSVDLKREIRYFGRVDQVMSTPDDEYWVVNHRVVWDNFARRGRAARRHPHPPRPAGPGDRLSPAPHRRHRLQRAAHRRRRARGRGPVPRAGGRGHPRPLQGRPPPQLPAGGVGHREQVHRRRVRPRGPAGGQRLRPPHLHHPVPGHHGADQPADGRATPSSSATPTSRSTPTRRRRSAPPACSSVPCRMIDEGLDISEYMAAHFRSRTDEEFDEEGLRFSPRRQAYRASLGGVPGADAERGQVARGRRHLDVSRGTSAPEAAAARPTRRPRCTGGGGRPARPR